MSNVFPSLLLEAVALISNMGHIIYKIIWLKYDFFWNFMTRKHLQVCKQISNILFPN